MEISTDLEGFVNQIIHFVNKMIDNPQIYVDQGRILPLHQDEDSVQYVHDIINEIFFNTRIDNNKGTICKFNDTKGDIINRNDLKSFIVSELTTKIVVQISGIKFVENELHYVVDITRSEDCKIGLDFYLHYMLNGNTKFKVLQQYIEFVLMSIKPENLIEMCEILSINYTLHPEFKKVLKDSFKIEDYIISDIANIIFQHLI